MQSRIQGFLDLSNQKAYIEQRLAPLARMPLTKGFSMYRLLGLLISFFLLLPPSLSAQKISCELQVDFKNLGDAQYELLTDFKSDVEDYIRDFTWGDPELDATISCTMTIFIRERIAENRFSAQVFIGSQRPIYNSEQSTAVLRLFDEEWEFTYVRNRPISHNLHSFDDLASFLDFYMYLFLGFDYDTYEPAGGSPWFQKTSEVASLGRATGQKGWDLKNSSYSRSQFIEEILGPKMTQARRAVYRYHFGGLDSLSANKARATENVFRALESLGKIRLEVDSRNLYIKSFFEAKYLEIAQLFEDYHDPNVYVKLSKIDPPHQSTYEEYRAKKKK